MLSILFHSSKTMQAQPHVASYQAPHFMSEATELMCYLQTLSPAKLQVAMKVSAPLAEKTKQLLAGWTADPEQQTPAIDIFRGDMYSGLRAADFSDYDRRYANEHFYILSGLYGILCALDSIAPYRLEMGYHLPDAPYQNLYKFWGEKLARQLPSETMVVNLSSTEYTKALLPYLPRERVITPQFLTRASPSHEPKFVAIHAKIARGALARYLIVRHAVSPDELIGFHDLGYHFEAAMSTPNQPVFICDEFRGLGLSIRKK